MTTNIRCKFPVHGWFGLSLVIIFWIINALTGLRTHWGFFPLWLGYCLAIDGLVFWRTGTSLLDRSPRKYIGLFLVSAPVWWISELLTLRTQNWTYLGAEIFSPLTYAFWTTLSFTPVIPAVFGSAEFFASFDFVKRIKPSLVIGTDKKTTASFFTLGWIMLALMLLYPKIFFPFIWLSLWNARLRRMPGSFFPAKEPLRPAWPGERPGSPRGSLPQ